MNPGSEKSPAVRRCVFGYIRRGTAIFAAERQTLQQRIDELRAWLVARQIRTIGNPQLARYNPPWTLPMFRRNEIMQEIE